MLILLKLEKVKVNREDAKIKQRKNKEMKMSNINLLAKFDIIWGTCVAL